MLAPAGSLAWTVSAFASCTLHHLSVISCVPLRAAVLPGCPPAAASWKLRPLDALLSLQRSWALITSSSLFKRLALCMAIVGVVSEGIQDMLIQYLQLVVGFNTADQSLLFTLLGAANLVVQVSWVLPARSPTCVSNSGMTVHNAVNAGLLWTLLVLVACLSW
jgi:hypothetical protein